ncbi:unnamed protein product [marine sediment metagenome]|uniref:Uncharacterized protein n=1 Tax=marine sediment metagenome TaxID=412755 RepID=X0Y078_9ZZZZ
MLLYLLSKVRLLLALVHDDDGDDNIAAAWSQVDVGGQRRATGAIVGFAMRSADGLDEAVRLLHRTLPLLNLLMSDDTYHPSAPSPRLSTIAITSTAASRNKSSSRSR